ncbi:hypothetical protein HanIR_Chr12g0603421 [Helianthus annuus]|nr:hypothetical protein HanIR_Chr12g0603421 [Helianthus annuus]
MLDIFVVIIKDTKLVIGHVYRFTCVPNFRYNKNNNNNDNNDNNNNNINNNNNYNNTEINILKINYLQILFK